MRPSRIQFDVLSKKHHALMKKLLDLHIRFVDISGQVLQTDEFGLFTALVKVLRPSLDVSTIQSIDWVVDSAGKRKVLWIQFFTPNLYPASEDIQIPLREIPKAVFPAP
jgi:hypothetical protein